MTASEQFITRYSAPRFLKYLQPSMLYCIVNLKGGKPRLFRGSTLRWLRKGRAPGSGFSNLGALRCGSEVSAASERGVGGSSDPERYQPVPERFNNGSGANFQLEGAYSDGSGMQLRQKTAGSGSGTLRLTTLGKSNRSYAALSRVTGWMGGLGPDFFLLVVRIYS